MLLKSLISFVKLICSISCICLVSLTDHLEYTKNLKYGNFMLLGKWCFLQEQSIPNFYQQAITFSALWNRVTLLGPEDSGASVGVAVHNGNSGNLWFTWEWVGFSQSVIPVSDGKWHQARLLNFTSRSYFVPSAFGINDAILLLFFVICFRLKIQEVQFKINVISGSLLWL